MSGKTKDPVHYILKSRLGGNLYSAGERQRVKDYANKHSIPVGSKGQADYWIQKGNK